MIYSEHFKPWKFYFLKLYHVNSLPEAAIDVLLTTGREEIRDEWPLPIHTVVLILIVKAQTMSDMLLGFIRLASIVNIGN